MEEKTRQDFLEHHGISTLENSADLGRYLWGDTSDRTKLSFLKTLVREKFHDKKILEIGTYRGTTTYSMALNLSSGTICTVDCGYEALKGLIEQEAPEHANKVNYSAYKVGEVYKTELAHHEQITQIIGDTTEESIAQKIIENGPYDLIYVDAAHTYEGIKNDTELSMQCLADNGIIIWDDYNGHWLGVNRFLDELSESRSLVYITDNRYVTYTNKGDK
jgi:predicted O-methyltransferase YrrM